MLAQMLGIGGGRAMNKFAPLRQKKSTRRRFTRCPPNMTTANRFAGSAGCAAHAAAHPRFGKPDGGLEISRRRRRAVLSRSFASTLRASASSSSRSRCGARRRARCAGAGRALPSPRPLYNLDSLAASPEAPIVICEGEKAADAAARIFPQERFRHVAGRRASGDAKPIGRRLPGAAC